MHTKSYFILLISTLILSIYGCAGSSLNEDQFDDNYIFDDLQSDTTFIRSSQRVVKEAEEGNGSDLQENLYNVQAGAFRSRIKAEKLASVIKERFGKESVISFNQNADLYLLTVTSFETEKEARDFIKILKRNKIDAFLK